MSSTTYLRHNRIDLALHRLADGDDPSARPLLLLHGLGERTPAAVPDGLAWPGPVLGLDFTGHGASTVPVGGGYTSEILVGDVDAALEELGQVTLLGRGLGAYIGLLIAAARPDRVRGVVLADGPGLVGGGMHPGSPSLPYPPAAPAGPPDPARPAGAVPGRAAARLRADLRALRGGGQRPAPSPCGCRRWCARSGWRRWPPSPVWAAAPWQRAWPPTPRAPG